MASQRVWLECGTMVRQVLMISQLSQSFLQAMCPCASEELKLFLLRVRCMAPDRGCPTQPPAPSQTGPVQDA